MKQLNFLFAQVFANKKNFFFKRQLCWGLEPTSETAYQQLSNESVPFTQGSVSQCILTEPPL